VNQIRDPRNHAGDRRAKAKELRLDQWLTPIRRSTPTGGRNRSPALDEAELVARFNQRAQDGTTNTTPRP
jgi:hypothetical protein